MIKIYYKMEKKIMIKNLLFGFLSWLIPFAISIPFFKPGGELLVPHDLFKSIMIVVGSISGCYLLLRYFKFVNSAFILNGVMVGLSWFIINIALDTIILIPMMNDSFVNYFYAIGLRYTVIPVISISMGFLLDRRINS